MQVNHHWAVDGVLNTHINLIRGGMDDGTPSKIGMRIHRIDISKDEQTVTDERTK
ncbi:hypothetical protein M2302_002829 [Micromonospora sp. A200]|nr:hypothetical protein [Micromonospora sp. A200]